MKKSILSYLYLPSLLTLVMLFCFNGSLTNSTSSDNAAKPDVNFYGVLEDHHRSAHVQNILISGKYKDIPVYQVPNKVDGKYADLDPKQNKILLDLNELKKIALKHAASPSESIIDVAGRKYVLISVESQNGTKKDYIVEHTKRVKCQEVDHGTSKNNTLYEERDLSFAHIKLLTIQGYKENNHQKKNEIEPTKQENSDQPKNVAPEDKNQFKKNTENIIDKIEENVKNLPHDNPTLFQKMKGTILTLLKSLRDQLQKFLDMIK